MSISRTQAFFRLTQALQTLGISIVLGLLFLLAPAVAQGEATAPIVVDGDPIFQVSTSGGYSAEYRAQNANFLLQEAIAADDSPQFRIDASNPPSIQLNGSQLITVTDRDASEGIPPLEQARIWRRQLVTAVEEARSRRTEAYLQRHLLMALVAVAVVVVLHWSLGRFWKAYLAPFVKTLLPNQDSDSERNEQNRFTSFVLGLLLAIARACLWIGAFYLVTEWFPVARQWRYRIIDSIQSSFTSPLLTLGQGSYSMIDLLVLVGMLFGLVIVSKTITDLFKSRILHMTGVNRGAQEAVAIIVRYSLIFIGSIVILQVWGLDISSLAILASALGVGIGFGLQDIAKNFGSGVVLIFERPIQVGDFVDVGEFQGTVERIGARSTLIRTLDQVSIIVPNSRFLEEEVINWSHGNPISRIHVPVGVAYGSDVPAVRKILLQAAREHSLVLSAPQPQVFFKGFGDSSLDFELLVWTVEPSKQVILSSDLYFRIEELLRQQEVEIPFPQRDLHVRSGHLPLALSPQLEQVIRQIMQQSGNGQTSHPKNSTSDW